MKTLNPYIVFVSLTLSINFAFFTHAETNKKIVEVTILADSEENGYEAFHAMDGNKQSLWHSEWQNKITKMPHLITVDLKNSTELNGCIITPRQDGNNGDIKNYEIFVTENPTKLNQPDAKNEINKNPQNKKSPILVNFSTPKKGRYFVLKINSNLNNDNFASIAELELLNNSTNFKAKKLSKAENELISILGETKNVNPEYVNEYSRLKNDIKNKSNFQKIAAETFLEDSLVLESDHDPTDIILRRTVALINDLKSSATPANLAKLDELEKKLFNLKSETEKIPVEQTSSRFESFIQICELRRQIAFANPLLNFNEILFVKKHRAKFNHMCDQYYGVNIPAGGGIFILSNPFEKNGEKSKVQNLLENAVVKSGRLAGKTLNTGSFLSPDLSFDTKKLAFAYVECEDNTAQQFHTDPTKGHWNEKRCFHIFTCDLKNESGIFVTENLRQITDGTWNDFDPCWLPNGRMAFITERRGGYLRCGRECPTYTLFDMNPDGSQIRCLSYHETNEWHPSVTHDGQILYTRWDYPDRHGCTAHHPWITTLDGRDPRHVHGNFSPRKSRADMELDCRVIPESPKFVATAAPHHGQAYGSLILVDPRVEDDDAMAPVKRLTPEVAFPESQGGTQVYGSAFPISEKYYLAVADFSMTSAVGAEWQNKNYIRGNYGIYLVDAFGNKELIYRDNEIGCNSPMPLLTRTMPNAQPQKISTNIEPQPYVEPLRNKIDSLEKGTVSIVNVYQSLRPLPKDIKLKELRVLQLIPMSVPSGRPPHETGFREPTSGDSVVLARHVLGTVPIEDDGSVHFNVPPRRELMLQVLDEEGLAVQSMRSSIYLHDGETLSCNGCHEPRTSAVTSASKFPKAMQRKPSQLKPDHPDSNPFSYPRLVQPVLDKNCVSCHAEERAKKTAGVPNLAKDPIKNKWYASFNELVPKYGFYSYGEPLRTTPGKFGARNSKLYSILKKGHHDVKLTPEELHRITLWLDCVSIFYGVYEKEAGEAQLRGEIAYPTL
ncbi:MAG: discoidin domain-containing protein, partial [Planctomycetaceae bacterium]|nr:discoidin domain-containing protein [Planctomycetaceae bacterium]